jgi:hypothetical protein
MLFTRLKEKNGKKLFFFTQAAQTAIDQFLVSRNFGVNNFLSHLYFQILIIFHDYFVSFLFFSLVSCFLTSIARRLECLSMASLHRRRGVFHEERRCWNFFSSVSASCEIHWCFVLIEVPSSRTQTCPESQTCFIVVVVEPYIVLPCFLSNLQFHCRPPSRVSG